MTPTMFLTAALLLPAAPLPKATAASGPAPYILQLKAGTDGKVKLQVMRTETVKMMTATVTAGPNGQQIVQQVEKEIPQTKMVMVELEELKDLKASTADGKELSPKEAAAKIGNGTMVLVSANGQKVDPAYTRMFKDEIVVLCSPDLVPTANVNSRFGRTGVINDNPPIFVNPPIIEAVPFPAPGGAGGIQIQVAPAVIQPLPPMPVKD